jgi:hypothetical protein
MTPLRLSMGFLAGFLAVLVFHQGLIAVLYGTGLVPFAPWAMTPVPPLGMPQVLSAAFWGGLWGIVYALLEPWLARRMRWWLGGLLFGAVLPVLVVWFVVQPLKGLPVGGGFAPASVLLVVLIHAVFGLGTAVLYRLGRHFARTAPRRL